MTREDAVRLYESKFWEEMTSYEIAMFQFFEPRLCMPFEVFNDALEKALGRPVFTHELGMNADGIKKELLGEVPAPTFDEIMGLIPEEKRVLVLT
jgi:hypothetical protein